MVNLSLTLDFDGASENTKTVMTNLMEEKVPTALKDLDIILVIAAGNEGYDNSAFPAREVTEMEGVGISDHRSRCVTSGREFGRYRPI